jgi:hypothetical protein
VWIEVENERKQNVKNFKQGLYKILLLNSKENFLLNLTIKKKL